MPTYVALTTTNFQENGYHELARGSDKNTVRSQAQESIGDVSTAYGTDIYKDTEQKNLIVIPLSEAKKKNYIRQ